MPAYVKDGGIWKPTLGAPWVRDGGIWKQASLGGHVKDGGIWKPLDSKPSLFYASSDYQPSTGFVSSYTFPGVYLGPLGAARKFVVYGIYWAGSGRTFSGISIEGVAGTAVARFTSSLSNAGALYEIDVTPGSALDLLEYGDVTLTTSAQMSSAQYTLVAVYNSFGAVYDAKQTGTTGTSTSRTMDLNLDQDGFTIVAVRNNSNSASTISGLEAEETLLPLQNYNKVSGQINPTSYAPRTIDASYPSSSPISWMLGGSWYRNP